MANTTKTDEPKRDGVRVRPARRSHKGVGYVSAYYVEGAPIAFGWGLTHGDAKRAVLRAAEEMGLVTDGVDCNV